MGTKVAGGRAGELAEVKRGFDHWRQSRQRGRQIPEPLWRMAVKAALIQGVQSTARRLGLNATRLQKQVQRLAPAQAAEDASSFVELPGWERLPSRSAFWRPKTTPAGNCVSI